MTSTSQIRTCRKTTNIVLICFKSVFLWCFLLLSRIYRKSKHNDQHCFIPTSAPATCRRYIHVVHYIVLNEILRKLDGKNVTFYITFLEKFPEIVFICIYLYITLNHSIIFQEIIIRPLYQLKIHMKVDKVGVVSYIVQNHSSSLYLGSHICSLLTQFTCKVDQKWNWVKLGVVWILFKIICLASMRQFEHGSNSFDHSLKVPSYIVSIVTGATCRAGNAHSFRNTLSHSLWEVHNFTHSLYIHYIIGQSWDYVYGLMTRLFAWIDRTTLSRTYVIASLFWPLEVKLGQYWPPLLKITILVPRKSYNYGPYSSQLTWKV